MGYISIQHVVKETKRRIGMLHLPYEDEYRAQLKHLGYKEKDILKEAFLRQEWNIGSSRVLSLLQEAHVLTASEFILSSESDELTLQIMNDLYETEYSLLAHLIKFAYQDSVQSRSITNVLTDSLRSLLTDLKDNPNVIPFNYLPPVAVHLRPDEMQRFKIEHLQCLLLGQEPSNVDDALGSQERWRKEMQTLHGTILGGLIVELMADMVPFIGLLKGWISKSCTFSLKYALYLLNVISKQLDLDKAGEKLVKDILKDLFRATLETGLVSNLQFLLLFAREICASNGSVLGVYSSWYKKTIGEMTYGVKKHEFIQIMEMLTGLLPLETSLDVLDVHSTIAISAPAKCNEYVLNYKQLCRAHIAQLQPPISPIVLDD